MYQTWENFVQGIRNINDIRRFQRIFDQTRNHFESELKKKKQCLTTYGAQNEAEYIEKMERLKTLQNQHFESNAKKQLAIKQHKNEMQLNLIRSTSIMQAEDKLTTIFNKFCQKFNETVNRLQNAVVNLQQQQQAEANQSGLSPTRIREFQIFTADESHVNEQCSICMEDVDVGRRMRRLTCDGQHYFCQECIEGWFAEHKTCPLCRHKFD